MSLIKNYKVLITIFLLILIGFSFLTFYYLPKNVTNQIALASNPLITTITPNYGTTDGGTSVTINGSGFLSQDTIDTIGLGDYGTCAVITAGGFKCWGLASSGQLGYNNFNNIGDNEFPSSVGNLSVSGTVVQIAMGYTHTCILLSTGNVKCWGYGGSGSLGYGNTNNISDASAVGNVNVGGTVTQIAVGSNHTCALLNTGNVRCWGSGFYGTLGYGNQNNIGDNETPASAGDVPLGGSVMQISASGTHSCALLSTGTVRCWGYNGSGELGYGNTSIIGDNETPNSISPVNVGGTVTQIAVGEDHSCALLSTGSVRCWGTDFNGQLGYGNTNNIGDNETPASAGDVNVGGTVSKLIAGGQGTCVILTTNNLRCWGLNNSGQLGYGNTNKIGDNETPASVGDVPVGSTVSQAIIGGRHMCAILTSGALKCWGLNNYGQLGYGNTSNIGDNETPASIGNVPVTLGITTVSVSFDGIDGTSLVVLSNTQLAVTTPPHSAGLVDVKVTNSDSSIYTLPSGYEYRNACSGNLGGGSSDQACITVGVTSGFLSISAPETISLTPVTVSDQNSYSVATISPVVITDPRGAGTGWSAYCTMSNLRGLTYTNEFITLLNSNSNSMFSVAPTSLQLYNSGSGTLNGVLDYNSVQDTYYLSSFDGNGESNPFPIAEFPSGYGFGQFKKDLELELTVPPFVRVQSYSGTLTCSVS